MERPQNNRVLDFINSEALRDRALLQQEKVLAALDAAKIDIKRAPGIT